MARAGPTAEPPAEEWGGDRLEVAQERYERDDRGAEGSASAASFLTEAAATAAPPARATAAQTTASRAMATPAATNARRAAAATGLRRLPLASQTIAMPAATPRPAATPSKYQSSTPSIGPV